MAVADFDVDALAAFLRGQGMVVDAGPFTVRRLSGGQSNGTFDVRVGDERFVLRKQPPGKLLPSAHAVDREYRIMKALGEHGVPVPRM